MTLNLTAWLPAEQQQLNPHVSLDVLLSSTSQTWNCWTQRDKNSVRFKILDDKVARRACVCLRNSRVHAVLVERLALSACPPTQSRYVWSNCGEQTHSSRCTEPHSHAGRRPQQRHRFIWVLDGTFQAVIVVPKGESSCNITTNGSGGHVR